MTNVGIIEWLIFGLLCRRCQTYCLGDGDSCNINDEFDNMTSVKMITNIMFKSRIINPAVGIFYRDTYIKIKWFIIIKQIQNYFL